MNPRLENVRAVPESTNDSDLSSTDGTSSSAGSTIDQIHPVVIGLFGSDGGDDLKSKFFHALCKDSATVKGIGSTLVQRGSPLSVNNADRNTQIWKFPSLCEGTWLQKAETFLCVTAHLKACIGRLHGVIYVHGIDDEEDGGAFQLFRTLIGDDGLTQSLILSSDPLEPHIEPQYAQIPRTTLSYVSPETCAEVLGQLLEPSYTPAPSLFQLEIAGGKSVGATTAGMLFSEWLKDAKQMLECALDHIYGHPVSPPAPRPPKSSPPRRRCTNSALSNDLSEAQLQIRKLQHAYATLERNSSDQISDLEESNQGLRSENQSLQAEVDTLKDALEELRAQVAQTQIDTLDFSIQTEPIPEPKPTREELKDEVLELKTKLAEAKMAEAEAVKRSSILSEELSKGKSSLSDVQKASAELKKKTTSLEKQVEALTKTTETRKEEIDKAKAETTKAHLQLKSTKDDLEKAQRQLKECTTGRAKLEEERSKAIGVSEGLLKVKDGVEKQLTESKAQVDTVKKRAAAEVDGLKKALAEKDRQIGEIARAAGVWASASAEVKRLKEELRMHKDCADARQREMHGELLTIRAGHEQANQGWELERANLNASILSLTQRNEETRDRLEAMVRERDAESQGYIERIAELERWGEQRWDAVGDNCVVA